jgi:hypothetical protein
VQQLQREGRAANDIDARTAARVLFGSLFADAMGRDVMPELYDESLEESADHYATVFLRAIGVDDADAAYTGGNGRASVRDRSTARRK